MKGCPLCNLEERTHWYAEMPRFAVLNCLKCGSPMWVQREHGPVNLETHRLARLFCTEYFGAAGAGIKFTGPKTVKDHYHEHVRMIPHKRRVKHEGQ